MNFTGLLVGLITFLIIGFFHPLVIKAEYGRQFLELSPSLHSGAYWK